MSIPADALVALLQRDLTGPGASPERASHDPGVVQLCELVTYSLGMAATGPAAVSAVHSVLAQADGPEIVRSALAASPGLPSYLASVAPPSGPMPVSPVSAAPFSPAPVTGGPLPPPARRKLSPMWIAGFVVIAVLLCGGGLVAAAVLLTASSFKDTAIGTWSCSSRRATVTIEVADGSFVVRDTSGNRHNGTWSLEGGTISLTGVPISLITGVPDKGKGEVTVNVTPRNSGKAADFSVKYSDRSAVITYIPQGSYDREEVVICNKQG
ncbi:hypothetical protein [Longispora albida]|uniref:hypothetical protein n=1 Tax=Longispora albida TaxID=203523 RepID=UPI000371DB3F|nr:hypothetical protein [Longispora albida]